MRTDLSSSGSAAAMWVAAGAVLGLGMLVLFVVVLVSTLMADSISGVPVVVDGDSLKFPARRERVRLEGVDAPESMQECLDRAGKRYRCGQAARAALSGVIAGKAVRCEGGRRDRYGRLLAVCFDSSGTDLNGWLVSNGWALAYRRYSTKYLAQEDAARTARRGIWKGRFVKPWLWRKQR